MSEDLKKTIRLVRKNKCITDDRGRTVWNVPIENTELELVSTERLEKMIAADGQRTKERIAKAARDKDGILAHNPADDRFQIIDDNDLMAALESADDVSEREISIASEDKPAFNDPDNGPEELSLVSTQMLRQLLGAEDDTEEEAPPAESGFNPYDHN